MAVEDEDDEDVEGESRLDRIRMRSERMPGNPPRNLPMRTTSATTTRIMITHSTALPLFRRAGADQFFVIVGSLNHVGPNEEPHFVASRGASRR